MKSNNYEKQQQRQAVVQLSADCVKLRIKHRKTTVSIRQKASRFLSGTLKLIGSCMSRSKTHHFT